MDIDEMIAAAKPEADRAATMFDGRTGTAALKAFGFAVVRYSDLQRALGELRDMRERVEELERSLALEAAS